MTFTLSTIRSSSSVADTGRATAYPPDPVTKRAAAARCPRSAREALADPADELREGHDDHDRQREPAEHHVGEAVIRVRRALDVLVLDVDESPDRNREDHDLQRILPPVEQEELRGAEVGDDVGDEQAQHADRAHVEEDVGGRRVVDAQADNGSDGDDHDHGQRVCRRTCSGRGLAEPT
jgi:hypothetical protein